MKSALLWRDSHFDIDKFHLLVILRRRGGVTDGGTHSRDDAVRLSCPCFGPTHALLTWTASSFASQSACRIAMRLDGAAAAACAAEDCTQSSVSHVRITFRAEVAPSSHRTSVRTEARANQRIKARKSSDRVSTCAHYAPSLQYLSMLGVYPSLDGVILVYLR